ncbi:Hsp20/alpha crystallin family protein [Leptolyngbya sp. FACHB-711]|uniref:Hsp20/alpha crystallin family protein n=1 Tax=unclassified Leptolyngbya TaxID=2650499 RepID=UPI0016885D86|nr:Hsp20/alpha crystallin family protein [Leptolyngbya sp. FACHB-711]MBD1852188.1 Hsp20/alpha crystallin family protein [Cyanobacteria bacterium FACHB-502]MBD2025008.1 Hsp20/alpha crystallin family protein [Leptolyngbya sp. FACHB-711]
MAIIRWNPWQEIDTLQRQFDRLFADTIAPTVGDDWKTFGRMPAAELSETEDAVQLKLEVPGVDAKDLNVEVTEDIVSIKGERKSETRSEDKGMSRSEFYYGTFQRVIPLPARIQNTQVQAEYKDGILHLTLPKQQEERNKVVKVELN